MRPLFHRLPLARGHTFATGNYHWTQGVLPERHPAPGTTTLGADLVGASGVRPPRTYEISLYPMDSASHRVATLLGPV